MENLQGGIYRPLECTQAYVTYLSAIAAQNYTVAAAVETLVYDCYEEDYIEWPFGPH